MWFGVGWVASTGVAWRGASMGGCEEEGERGRRAAVWLGSVGEAVGAAAPRAPLMSARVVAVSVVGARAGRVRRARRSVRESVCVGVSSRGGKKMGRPGRIGI